MSMTSSRPTFRAEQKKLRPVLYGTRRSFFVHRTKDKAVASPIGIWYTQRKREPSHQTIARFPLLFSPNLYNRHAYRREEHTPTLCVPIEWAFWHDKGTSPSLGSPFRVHGGNSVSPPAEQCDQCSVEEDVYQ